MASSFEPSVLTNATGENGGHRVRRGFAFRWRRLARRPKIEDDRGVVEFVCGTPTLTSPSPVSSFLRCSSRVNLRALKNASFSEMSSANVKVPYSMSSLSHSGLEIVIRDAHSRGFCFCRSMWTGDHFYNFSGRCEQAIVCSVAWVPLRHPSGRLRSPTPLCYLRSAICLIMLRSVCQPSLRSLITCGENLAG